MMLVKNFSVVVMALSLMVLAFGYMVASAQTAPGTPASVVVQQPAASGSAPSIPSTKLSRRRPGRVRL